MTQTREVKTKRMVQKENVSILGNAGRVPKSELPVELAPTTASAEGMELTQKMKVRELKEIAKNLNIDIKGLRLKADILKAIQLGRNEP